MHSVSRYDHLTLNTLDFCTILGNFHTKTTYINESFIKIWNKNLKLQWTMGEFFIISVNCISLSCYKKNIYLIL